MVSFDAGLTLADRFRAHAGDRSHLYGCAMRAMATDWEAGGPVREVCRGYEDAPPGSVVQLRLLAGVFRLVLTGRAEALWPYYPCLGGDQPPDRAWPTMRAVIGDHVAELHDALRTSPQTNEVGRSAALLVGLFDVVRRSGLRTVRLLEVGASAGLNLLVDRFRFAGPGWAAGPEGSPVQFRDAVAGRVEPVPYAIGARRGCDLHPVDPRTADGRLLLTSFVWPFDLDRHARLAAALEVASTAPVRVDPAPGSAWLTEQLADTAAADPGDDVLTVVWHSITRMYWPPAERVAVDATLADAGARRPLATVSMEYAEPGTPGSTPELVTCWWPGDGREPESRRLGTAHDHGLPVRIP